MIELKLPHQGTIGYDGVCVTIPGEHPTPQGAELALQTNAGVQLGKWKVLDCWVGEIHRIPAALLEFHFDPLCKTFTGLCTCHQMMAGPEAARPGARCTALVIRRVAEDELVVVNGRAVADAVLGGVAGARKST